ncbi:MAG: hypothetical protein IT326_03970 [Anaerolineae bacterium]|nr:hypothetical protein [Anaerolineae bacterium]
MAGSSSPRFSPRAIMGQAVLAAFGLALAALAAEGVLRVFPALMPINARLWGTLPEVDNRHERHMGAAVPGHPELDYLFFAGRSTTTIHPEYTFTVDTSGLTFDEVGFRDEGIEGDPFAVAIGDSFVMGWGVEADETWVELLEQETGRDFANLGVLGSSSIKELGVLERYGLSLQPRLILYGVYANDPADDAWVQAKLAQGMTAEELLVQQVTGNSPLYRVRQFFSHNSYLYRFLGYLYYSTRTEEAAQCAYEQGDIRYTFDIGGWGKTLAFDDPALEQGLESVVSNIREAQQASSEAGAELVVVVFPAKEQLYPDYLAGPCDAAELAARFEHFNRTIMDLCQQENLHCLDLGSSMLAQGLPADPIYFNVDAHWTPAGNRFAAGIIREYLDSNGFLMVE